MEDATTCTAGCGDGYYLDHGNAWLLRPSTRDGVTLCEGCSSRRCKRVQKVQPGLPEVHLRQHLHPLQTPHQVTQR